MVPLYHHHEHHQQPHHNRSATSNKKLSDKGESPGNQRQSVKMLKWKARSATTSVAVGFSAFRRARIMHKRLITKEEYVRLKQMVPAIATQQRVSKVQVIEEAIKYIDYLHLALFQRLRTQDPQQTGAMAQDSKTTMDQGQLRQWIAQMLPTQAVQLLAQHLHHRERIKKWPSFLDKVDRMVRKKNSQVQHSY